MVIKIFAIFFTTIGVLWTGAAIFSIVTEIHDNIKYHTHSRWNRWEK